MNRPERTAGHVSAFARGVLSLFAAPRLDIREDYPKVRRIQRLLARRPRHPYRILDQTVTGTDGRPIPVRVFLPKARTRPGALVFFHGGGWVIGDLDSYTAACTTMADLTGQTVCSVDYRLAPENPFPAGLQDCVRVTQYLLERPDLVAARTPDEVTLIGDSAGGNLAAAVSLLLHDRGATMPGRQILLYPVTQWDHDPETSVFPSVREHGIGLRLTSQEVKDYLEMYQPDPELRREPYLSPLAADDLTGQPDTLVVTAELDLLRDEGEAYGHALRAVGNQVRIERVDEALHGFITLPRFARPVQNAYRLITAFLDGDLVDSRPLAGSAEAEATS